MQQKCKREHLIKRCKIKGLAARKGCGRTFNALTLLSRLRHKKRWLSFGESMTRGATLKEAAERCDVTTAFRRRCRFLEAARLKGIVEADDILASRKRERKLRPGAGRKSEETRSVAGAGCGSGRPQRNDRVLPGTGGDSLK